MADPDGPYGAMYGHNGGGTGYSASAFHFPTTTGDPAGGVTVAVLCNTENIQEAEMMMLALTETLTDRYGS